MRWIVWVMLLLVLAVPGRAQTTSTTILGTVTDQSGAPAVDVEVAATHVATNQVRTTKTNEQGYYVLPALDSGDYRVTARKTGFKTQVRSGITLQVNQRLNVDFTLDVGD